MQDKTDIVPLDEFDAPFPVTEVHREGYGLVTQGRADIDPAVHPDMEFDAEGDLLPPREWGA